MQVVDWAEANTYISNQNTTEGKMTVRKTTIKKMLKEVHKAERESRQNITSRRKMAGFEVEAEIETECPKCKHKFTATGITFVDIEPPEMDEP